MKRISCIVATIASCMWLMPAIAADDEHKQSQQSRTASCAHESKGMKSEERHHFMSECLKGHAADAPVKEAKREPGSQQNRMRACNDEARTKDLHGDERRAFMSSCLRG